MRFWRGALTLLCICTTGGACLADCGHSSVVIQGSETERIEACLALRQVREYFLSIGSKVQPEFRLEFLDEVFVDLPGPDEGQPGEKLRVSGMFDANRLLIQVTSADSKKQLERRPWGVGWGPEAANSFLRHELVHMAVSQLSRGRRHSFSRAWIEYIAYCIQFELMPESLRVRIMNANVEVEPFSAPEQVNDFVYSVNPDLFGLRAHLYTKINGGRQFIKQVIADQVSFSTSEINFIR